MLFLVILYHLVVYPIRTWRFRRSAKPYDRCRFYVNDCKYLGIIRRMVGDYSEVEYLDINNGRLGCRSLHKSQLYPLW